MNDLWTVIRNQSLPLFKQYSLFWRHSQKRENINMQTPRNSTEAWQNRVNIKPLQWYWFFCPRHCLPFHCRHCWLTRQWYASCSFHTQKRFKLAVDCFKYLSGNQGCEIHVQISWLETRGNESRPELNIEKKNCLNWFSLMFV